MIILYTMYFLALQRLFGASYKFSLFNQLFSVPQSTGSTKFMATHILTWFPNKNEEN